MFPTGIRPCNVLKCLSLALLISGALKTHGQDSDTIPCNDSVAPLIYRIPLADTMFTFHWHNPEATELMLLVIHDDENTSSEVGYSSMHQYGASLLEKKYNQQYLFRMNFNREEYMFNPNRIFNASGLRNNMLKIGNYSDTARWLIGQVASQVAGAFFQDQKFIVALHNNNDLGFSILSYITDTTLMNLTDSIFINPEIDPDDFFYVTDPEHFRILRNAGFNVVLQSCDMSTDDGSLSYWCVRNRIPYVNIEAEHLHHTEQLFMLDVLYDLIIRK
ncbi:MAG TPA: hypothetical protein P5228_11860 [Bacteroidales bacterium]|nr:hypothetical protein [Bacteroidales bacterium]HRZ49768.1 hypothetical protein [Bacteroidales bacterium]